MFELYFCRDDGENMFISNCEDFSSVTKSIKKFLEEYHFESYYQRLWKSQSNCITVDFGSHSEFFEIIAEPQIIDTTINSFWKGENNE